MVRAVSFPGGPNHQPLAPTYGRATVHDRPDGRKQDAATRAEYRMAGQHFLIVPEEPDDDLDIEHPPDCPTEELAWGDGSVLAHACAVAGLIYEFGLSDFFHRATDPDQDLKQGQLVTPGRHPITYWSSKTYSHYYGSWEYDAGLELGES